MIISRTPYRISFLGGGTDYPGWYQRHGGAVLSTSIDKYCYLTCRFLPPFFEHRYRVVYSTTEDRLSLDEIKHPAVREGIRLSGITQGLEIHHDGDLPARSGMGSSSSFAVGLLHVLHGIQSRMVSKEQLAKESIHLEQVILKENVGSQDQISAAYGGFNHISFLPNGDFIVQPIILEKQRLQDFESHFMLLFTGISRTASDIVANFIPRIEDRKKELCLLRELVEEGLALLTRGNDLSSFGELLHEAWVAKKALSNNVSNAEIDNIYEKAREAGAIGGKLVGAGGGGFLLLFVPPVLQTKVREALPFLIHVPFGFESEGSRIIFYDREQDYAAASAERDRRSVASFREWNPSHQSI